MMEYTSCYIEHKKKKRYTPEAILEIQAPHTQKEEDKS